jgi:hypothetical protein
MTVTGPSGYRQLCPYTAYLTVGTAQPSVTFIPDADLLRDFRHFPKQSIHIVEIANRAARFDDGREPAFNPDRD